MGTEPVLDGLAAQRAENAMAWCPPCAARVAWPVCGRLLDGRRTGRADGRRWLDRKRGRKRGDCCLGAGRAPDCG
eukprot:11202227-Lingulodinium_polyedra.AAC.1